MYMLHFKLNGFKLFSIYSGLIALVESSQQGLNGCLPQASTEPSPIEFTAGPATESQRDEESADDEDDDEDDVVAEAGQGSDAAAVEKPCIRDVVADDELPPQSVSSFDGRQKRSGFIDVWWLFDDGGLRLNRVA